MTINMPYWSPKSEEILLIADSLVNGNLSGSDANLLVQKESIPWQKVALHVEDIDKKISHRTRPRNRN